MDCIDSYDWVGRFRNHAVLHRVNPLPGILPTDRQSLLSSRSRCCHVAAVGSGTVSTIHQRIVGQSFSTDDTREALFKPPNISSDEEVDQAIMARLLTYSCLSALYLLQHNASAFVAPTSHAKIPSSSSLFSTTEDAIINESYVAPLNEIERRRNLAIISHPDSGE